MTKVDYDYEKLGIPRSSAIYIAHRAKKLDEIAKRFTVRHPNAVGLDLGAGLDSRALRVALPPTADWHDIDFPEVIAARRQLVPDRATPRGIGADLTDPTWLDALPTDRPVVAVAERADRVPLRRGDEPNPSGTSPSPRYPERWNPKLKLVKEILCTREPEVNEFPLGLRLMNRLSAPSTAVSRREMWSCTTDSSFPAVSRLRKARLGALAIRRRSRCDRRAR